jgi:hypothetical protein
VKHAHNECGNGLRRSVPSAAQGCPLTSLEALFRREWVSRVLPMASNGAGAAGIVALPAPWTGAEEEIPGGSTGGRGAELPKARSDTMKGWSVGDGLRMAKPHATTSNGD